MFVRVVINDGVASGPGLVGIHDGIAVGLRRSWCRRTLRACAQGSEADRAQCRLDVVVVDGKQVGFPSAERQGVATLQYV